MAEICCLVVGENEGSSGYEPSSREARRRRMEIRRFKTVAGEVAAPTESEVLAKDDGRKRQKVEVYTSSFSRDCDNAVENCASVNGEEDGKKLHQLVKVENGRVKTKEIIIYSRSLKLPLSPTILTCSADLPLFPKYGVASVCGRRRDMEDAVALHPSFCRKQNDAASELHFFGVYDGHGCSHVAMRCREKLHEIVKEEVEMEEEGASMEWRSTMRRSFWRMDKEVVAWNRDVIGAASCRCEMQTPECDAVGSTAVVAVLTPREIVVANCGDSRAVLCRNGKPIPLSSDHKPDRPDELNRIQAAGGRVIYWDGPRVLGVLAMSRAIGDNYLKPYVSCDPELTVTDRMAEDECLILASDGLWDVVSNDTACSVARMCLRGKGTRGRSTEEEERSASSGGGERGTVADKACSDAAMLLTKLALARHSTDNVSVVVVDLRRRNT